MVSQTSTEQWIIRRLGVPCLLDGVTTIDDRRERVRNLLLDRHLEPAIHETTKTPAVTWGEVFIQAYGREL